MTCAAQIVMWCDVEAAFDEEFERWHSREHLPERVGIAGFLRGMRWKSAGAEPRYFLRYDVEGPEVFASAAYLARLNDPTPWTRRMMPHIRNMTRSVCRVAGGAGAGEGGALLTCRLAQREPEALLEPLSRLAARRGVCSARLLRDMTDMSTSGPSWEERTRGGDARVGLALAVEGYDGATLREAAAEFALTGALAGSEVDLFTLRESLRQASGCGQFAGNMAEGRK